MQTATPQQVKELAKRDVGHGVSVYVPTEKDPADMSKAALQLKNGIDRAEKRLLARGLPKRDVHERLKQAEPLLKNVRSWFQPGKGLVVFLDSDSVHLLQARPTFGPLSAVGSVFHLVPLVRAVHDTDFYILALSLAKVRLLRTDVGTVREISLPSDAPESVDDMIRREQEERTTHLQLHTSSSPRAPAKAGVFHGHGAREKPETEWTLQYLREIDRAIEPELHGGDAPLVVAADVSVFSLYREANTHQHLCEDFVRGNPDELAAAELYERARPIVEKKVGAARREAIARVQEAVGTDRGTADPAGAVRAAAQGRVDMVLIATSPAAAPAWGRLNTETMNVQRLPEEAPEGEDLTNLAAVYTLRNGGQVLVVEPGELPDSADAGLVTAFRY